MAEKHAPATQSPQQVPSGASAIWALEVLERQAMEVLNRFERRSGPGDGVRSVSLGDDHLGFYAVSADRMEDFQILQLGLLNLAIAKELRAIPPHEYTAEDADRLLYAAVFGTRCVTTAQYVMSDAWQKLKEVKDARSRGGKATKKLTSARDMLLLEIAYAKHKGNKAPFQKTADELLDHEIDVCARTVRDRLTELGMR